MTVGQLTTMRFALALNWAGTMHEQLRYAQRAQPQLEERQSVAPDPRYGSESLAPAAAHWLVDSGPLQVDTAHPAYAEPHPPTGSFAVTGPYDHTAAASGGHTGYETHYDTSSAPQYDTGSYSQYDTGTFPHYDQQAAAEDPHPTSGRHYATADPGRGAAAPLDTPRPYVQAAEPPAWDDIWRR